jgi:hypothetical protein
VAREWLKRNKIKYGQKRKVNKNVGLELKIKERSTAVVKAKIDKEKIYKRGRKEV